MRLLSLIAMLLTATTMLLSGCEKKSEETLDPLPPMSWQNLDITPFLPEAKWQDTEKDWSALNDSLRITIDIPEALETKLTKDDRELWRNALTNVEKAQINRKEASILSTIQITPPMECLPPSSAFSLQQRSQLQLTLQLHRNALWRMGRLEMASRNVSNALKTFLPLFSGGRIKDADHSIVEPMMKMVAEIDTLRASHKSPKGEWMPGKFQFRMARTAHANPIFLQAHTMLTQWRSQMEANERWRYLANSADPIIQSLETWIEEYKTLIQAFHALNTNIQLLERDFAPPHSLVAYPCINQNLRTLRILSDIYTHILPMQWDLSQAYDDAERVLARLHSQDYASTNHDFLASEVEAFIAQVSSQKSKLARCEDLILISWDDASNKFWGGLPDFVDAIHYHSKPAVENAETWNLMFQQIKDELEKTRKLIAAEPQQPLNKHGKPYPAYISSVLETLHAPARIDEVERSLLAISELEAHMVSIRDELLRLCKQGGCRSFPEAEIANSPRMNAWVVSWRQAPSNERTLGHSLIVVKLCQLHLARLVQRMTEIYAWFSETSNADLSWKKLGSWQRIWTLYAEPNGTYASFLKSVAALDKSIADMTELPQNRAVSDNLLQLLRIQDQFFDLTIDYARFLDSKKPAPTSFDELVAAWEDLDGQLVAIENLTLARDEAENPELSEAKKKRKSVVDIPR